LICVVAWETWPRISCTLRPLGQQIQERDGLVLDDFLGTAWHSALSGMLDAMQALMQEGNMDPLAIRELDWALWELTPTTARSAG
jgi:hypothetical protein